MDSKSPTLKWIASAIIIVASAAGSYYLYLKWKRENLCNHSDENYEENVNPKRSQQEQREIANNLRLKGNELFNEGHYKDAILLYNNAMDICPKQYEQDRAKLYQNKSASLFYLDDLDGALLEANNSLRLSPRYKSALIRRSKIYEAKNQLKEALNDLVAAVIFDSSEQSDSTNRMDNLLEKIAIPVIEEELKKEMIVLSDYDMDNYLQSFPSDPMLQLQYDDNDGSEILQSIELYKLKKYCDSYQAIHEDLLIANLSERSLNLLYFLRGTFYVFNCRCNEGLDDLTMVIKSDYSSLHMKINAIIKRAGIMIMNGNCINVEDLFEEAILLNGQCPDIYYHRGLLYESMDEHNKAIDDYQIALQLYPQYSFAAVHKIFNQYLLTNELNMKEFNNLMISFPNSIEVHMLYVKVLMQEEKFEEAQSVSLVLLSLQPNSSAIMSLVAEIKISKKEVQEAKKILMSAIIKDPRHGKLYRVLAGIYVRNGDLTAGIQQLDCAIKFAQNQRDLKDYIELREGILAQLNVSTTFDIPVKEVINYMSQGAMGNPSII